MNKETLAPRQPDRNTASTNNLKRAFKVRCVFLLDASAATESLSSLQQALTYIAPVALEVDENGQMPVLLFGAGEAQALASPLNAENFLSYPEHHLASQIAPFACGIVNFNAAFESLLDSEGFVKPSLFGGRIVRDPNPEVTLVFLCSSREPEDGRAMEKTLVKLESSSSWVYTNFIAVGESGSDFALQKHWAQKYANVGFLNLAGLKEPSQAKLYSRLIHQELEKWVNTQTGIGLPGAHGQVATASGADVLPDHLSTDPASPHYNENVLSRPVGIRFNGIEKTNVEEYCISEGWIRVPAGKTLDRKGRALLLKIKGKVEAYYRD